LSIATDLSAALGSADIISSATLTRTPLIHGQLIAAGVHVDLVGSFTPEMREADSDLFRRGHLVVDSLTALHESGDIIAPLVEGLIPVPVPDLTVLLRDPGKGRKRDDQITVFKSVGTGLADLATARYVLERHRNRARAITHNIKLQLDTIS
jgi:ornithine cyclodeaminase